jgi:RNA-binding protein Musashi
MVESDEGKLFIGGVAWETTEEKLKDHFSQYGDVSHALVMRDKVTGRPRGFAFVVFSDPTAVDLALLHSHTIDGRTVDAKRALSREEQQTSSRSSGLTGIHKPSSGKGNFRTKKIFVGGLPSTITEEGFREYFEIYGQVTDVVVMYDPSTRRPRGFGFITFSSEEAVDKVLHKTFHELHGKLVEVKPAVPKDASTGNQSGGYQGYGANSSGIDVRMDYVQPQNSTGGGLIPYSGYGPVLGFGAANSVGYGGYSGYGYGSVNTGFGGPIGAYANPTAPNPGFIIWGPGAFSNAYPSGYGASVYGGSGTYVPVAAPIGQLPNGASGYRKQGYGYGNNSVSGPYSGS